MSLVIPAIPALTPEGMVDARTADAGNRAEQARARFTVRAIPDLSPPVIDPRTAVLLEPSPFIQGSLAVDFSGDCDAAQDAQELLARWIEKAEGNLVAILDDIEPCAAHIDSEIGALRHARGRAFQNEANGNTWWTAFDDVVVEARFSAQPMPKICERFRRKLLGRVADFFVPRDASRLVGVGRQFEAGIVQSSCTNAVYTGRGPHPSQCLR